MHCSKRDVTKLRVLANKYRFYTTCIIAQRQAACFEFLWDVMIKQNYNREITEISYFLRIDKHTSFTVDPVKAFIWRKYHHGTRASV
jgi:hypothetical protein